MDLPHGEIFTFYSYKGGVGRSMALANVACLLAKKHVEGENVLMIDWDLEAPGLHQFFHGRYNDKKDDQADLPAGQLGLIDLFYEIKDRLEESNVRGDISDDFFDEIDIQKYIIGIKLPSLFLMPAGRFDDGLYSTRVNEFNWADFFDKHPSVFTQFAQYLQKKFRFVLIDSRTGYTDISGICTSLMPEKLVVVFTPNRQSLKGIVELIRNATNYRKQSDDLRTLVVFPLPSRIENAERILQKDWREGNPTQNIKGYQKQLETVLKEVYDLQECDLTTYFDEVQLQYVPHYSYGEEIAVLSERAEERLSLPRSFDIFTEKLIDVESPWDRQGKTLTAEKRIEKPDALWPEGLPRVEEKPESKARPLPLQILIALIGLIGVILVASLPAYKNWLFPAGTPSVTSTFVTTMIQASTLTSTLTFEPSFTSTPLSLPPTQPPPPPIEAIFSVSGPVIYYSDPLLRNEKGSLEGKFYVCARYISGSTILNYQIAEKLEDCSSGLALGWVSEAYVILVDKFPEALTTLVPPDAKECEDGIDNDNDRLIDYPSDPGCSSATDNTEDIIEPPPTATITSTCPHLSSRTYLQGTASYSGQVTINNPANCTTAYEPETAIDTRGAYSRIPPGTLIWVLIYPPNGLYYPQSPNACATPIAPPPIQGGGNWNVDTFLGLKGNPPEWFDIVVVLTDQTTSDYLSDWLHDGCLAGFSGIEPAVLEQMDITEKAYITVQTK
jgi:MinD-like ATPase involved in chromosome partitioning or flagellar assembly